MTRLDKNLKPIVGVSACLVGENVRYDGGHKLQPLISDCLAPFVTLSPVCPEVRAGLGVPRPTIQLQKKTTGIRAIINAKTSATRDVSDELTKVAVQYLNENRERPLCGFIFKSRSPSCGLGSTPVITHKKNFTNGLFADYFCQQFESLPMVEESWLFNEERHFRFLSACYLFFSHNYGGEIDSDLLQCIDPALRSDDTKTYKQMVATLLSGNLLAENFLAENKSSNLNEQAALEERLVDYWRARKCK